MLQMYLSTMEDVFKQDLVAELKGRVQRAERVVITAHRSPDGDAIGSSLALQHLLACMDVSSQVVMPDGYPDFLNWLPGQEHVQFHDADPEGCEATLLGADVVFCLDYNAPSRAGDSDLGGECGFSSRDLRGRRRSPPAAGRLRGFAVVRPVDRQHGGIDIPPDVGGDMADDLNADMASCLYCGLITDTGSSDFLGHPADPRMAGHLLGTGMDHSKVHSLIYDACRLDQIRLTSYALGQKLQVFPEYNSAVVSLSLEELERFNAQKGDTEGLVNRALSIEGIRFAVFVKEDVDRVKMSLRSTGSFSVRDVAAAHFNGGGHHNAAGGACPGESLDSVVSRLIELLPSYASQLQDEG